jgi:hypothetical protein
MQMSLERCGYSFNVHTLLIQTLRNTEQVLDMGNCCAHFRMQLERAFDVHRFEILGSKDWLVVVREM